MESRKILTLLIDNYDSYTYNLYQMLAELNGIAPVVINNDAYNGKWDTAWKDLRKKYAIDNIVISPGPGNPAKESDFGLCLDALKSSPVPILGVCLGHQGLVHAYGGRITYAPIAIHGRVSQIKVLTNYKDDLFYSIPKTFNVVRYHSLVAERVLPNCLELLAITEEEGQSIIMGVKHREKPLWGVQFHPEAVCTQYGYQLLQNFRDISIGQTTLSICSMSHSKSGRNIQYTMAISSIASKYNLLVKKIILGKNSISSSCMFQKAFSSSSHSFWLDSSMTQEKGRFSYMGDALGPMSYILEYYCCPFEKNTPRIRIRRELADGTYDESDISTELCSFLRNELKNGENIQPIDYKNYLMNGSKTLVDLPFDFYGGFVGYFGYESLDSSTDTKLEKVSSVPDAAFIMADRIVAFDHHTNIAYLLCLIPVDPVSDGLDMKENVDWMARMESYINDKVNEDFLCSTTTSSDSDTVTSGKASIDFKPSCSHENYVENIESILHSIHEGETYEVCLTNHLVTEKKIEDPLALYQTLRFNNPAPYAAFFRIDPRRTHKYSKEAEWMTSQDCISNSCSFAICCSSPERFLRIDKDRIVESKPIKGTRKRGKTTEEDALIAKALEQSEKDRAENMMIADLVRNDIGKVSSIGTVHVPKLMKVETYRTVHQLVTTVRSVLHDSCDAIDAIKATFPGGSMTGAPKIRTMSIIRSLETHKRGPYSGALGFLSFCGSIDLNIVIRTAIVTDDRVSIGAGGAIVAMSDINEEYDEMLLKAKALIASVGIYKTGRVGGAFVQI